MSWRLMGPRAGGLAGLLALFLLAACTGTQEARLPTLLIVGSAVAGGGQLELVEDVYDPNASAARSLVPVAGSARSLPAPPVSLDVVDRAGSRPELVALLRGEALAELAFFNIADLDASQPNDFNPSRARIQLGPMLEPTLPDGEPLCLSEVQVSGDGRYAALLDDGSCRDQGIPDLHVVDLRDETRLMSLSEEHPALQLLPAGIFIDQELGLLYFAVESLGRTEVRSLPLSGAANAALVGSADLDPVSQELTDLAPSGNAIALLSERSYALVPVNGAGGSDGDPVRTHSTTTGARLLLSDPGGSLDRLVVLSSTRAILHEAGEDGAEETLALESPLVDATLEPIQRFAYLLEEGGIEILDLFPYAEPPGNRLLFEPLPGIDDPRVISWVHGFAPDGNGP